MTMKRKPKVLDDLPDRFRQAQDEFYEQKERLQASEHYGWWKGLTRQRRALYGTLAVLVVLGILAMLFGG